MPEAVRESRPLDQFHHKVVRTDIIDVTDVGMIERGDSSDFALEPIVETIGRELDGDLATHAPVACAIDFTHTAGAERCDDFIRAEPTASSK